MKNASFLLMFSFLSFLLLGCQQEKKKTSSSVSAYCSTGTNYYTDPTCPGYNSGGSNGGANCGGELYYTTPGCVGFCSIPANQSNPACSGGNTTTGGGTGGVSCSTAPYSFDCYCQTNPSAYGCPSQPTQVSTNWGVKYPVMPTGSCSDPVNPSSGSFFPPRKGTITINGGAWYNPADPVAPNYVNTLSTLKSVSTAKTFFLTDSVLKVRFKINPEPDAAGSAPNEYCYGRNTGTALAGYTKLQFNVKLVGTKSDGTTGEEYLGTQTVGVNSCSPAIDLSNYTSYFPQGMYLVISGVKGNKGAWPPDYDAMGFLNSNAFATVRTVECWSMDIEVAADGTKTFN